MDRLDQLVERTRQQKPLIGPWWRRRAAWRIWTRGTTDAIRRLAEIVVRTEDAPLRDYVVELLQQVDGQDRLDAVCQVWANTRNPALAGLIEKKGWLAAEPIRLRVLNALWLGLQESMANAPTAAVPHLIEATRDRDPRIAASATAVLRALTRADAQSFVCDLVLDQDDAVARESAYAGSYVPQNAARRALFFFLTGQWQKYESLDFDGSYLRAAYEVAGPDLRKRLAEVARRAGRMEYVAAAAREGRRVGEMTDVEWESAVAVLAGGARWAELWRLAQVAPPRWSAAILLRLATEEQPPAEISPEAFAELVESARNWTDPEHHYEQSATSGAGATSAAGSRRPVAPAAVAVSPDGALVLTSGPTADVRIWPVAAIGRPGSPSLVKQLGFAATHLAVSPDSRVLAAAGANGIIMLLGIPEGRQMARLVAHVGGVSGLAARDTPQGMRLISTGDDGRVRFFSLPVGTELRTLGRGPTPATALALSGAGWIATGDAVGDLRLFDPARPGDESVWTIRLSGPVRQTVFADSDRTLAAVAGEKLALVRCPHGKPSIDMSPRVGQIACLAACAASRTVCVGGLGGDIAIVRAEDGGSINKLSAHVGPVTAMATDRGGHLLLTGGADGVVKLWALPQAEPLYTLRVDGGGAVTYVGFVPDGSLALAGFAHERELRSIPLAAWRVANVPLADLSLSDLNYLQAADDRKSRFVATLLARRFAHDVLVENVSSRSIVVGEFDIRLD